MTRQQADVCEHFLPVTGTKVVKGNAKDGTKFFTVNFGDGNNKMGKVGAITFYTNETSCFNSKLYIFRTKKCNSTSLYLFSFLFFILF